MKLTLLLLALFTLPLAAQEPVTTGMVQQIMAKEGTMTVMSDQTHRPISFVGLNGAMLVNANGQPGMLADLKEGMPVTVQYAVREKQWYVSKLIFGSSPTAGAATTVAPAAGTAAAPAPGAPMPMPMPMPSSNAAIPGSPKMPANTDPASAGRPDSQRTQGGAPVRSRSGGNAPR